MHQAGPKEEGSGIPYPWDLREEEPGDREIKENMALCLECYAAKDGAPFGV